MGDMKSDYYSAPLFQRYYIMFYYCILLIIGNDINPATQSEVRICSSLLFFGAFVEAYIIGGITSEMTKGEDQKRKTDRMIDFVGYSMDIHVFPNKIKSSINMFLSKFSENIECRPEISDFIDVINPAL
jgi:hypothetical protein